MNKRTIYIAFCTGLILSSITSRLFSQSVKATVDKNRIFIGEQIKLKLSIDRPVAGIPWFHFPDSVNHIEVVRRSKIDTVISAGSTSYQQTIAITSFDSGRWEFPSLSIAGLNQVTPPIVIDVLPVDVSNMKDYNDIKEIEEVQQENDWIITGIIATVTLLSIGLIYWLYTQKKRSVAAVHPLKGNLTPLEWALGELAKLNSARLQTPVEVKKYYSDLSEISRKFFNMQLQQQSLQKTTDEWMVGLQDLSVDNEVKTSFFQFLRLADTVKFAKYLPPERESEDSVEVIKRMLQKVSLLHSSIYSNYQPKQS